MIAVLKVCYLLAVTAILFAVPAVPLTHPARWIVIPALLSIQVITLLACRVDVREIFWAAWRLKWLFAFLLGTYLSDSVRLLGFAANAFWFTTGWHYVKQPARSMYSIARNRSMNPLNPRALHRAMKRARSFAKYARTVVSFVHHGAHGAKFKARRRRSR